MIICMISCNNDMYHKWNHRLKPMLSDMLSYTPPFLRCMILSEKYDIVYDIIVLRTSLYDIILNIKYKIPILLYFSRISPTISYKFHMLLPIIPETSDINHGFTYN